MWLRPEVCNDWGHAEGGNRSRQLRWRRSSRNHHRGRWRVRETVTTPNVRRAARPDPSSAKPAPVRASARPLGRCPARDEGGGHAARRGDREAKGWLTSASCRCYTKGKGLWGYRRGHGRWQPRGFCPRDGLKAWGSRYRRDTPGLRGGNGDVRRGEILFCFRTGRASPV